MPQRSRHSTAATLTLVAVLTMVAACGEPPQVAPTPTGPLLPSPQTSGPSTSPPPPTLGPGSFTPPAGRAVSCGGEPSAEEILDLLREEGLLTGDTEATVAEGPLCEQDWQYTVIEVPDRDPLQVVTSGDPGDLTLVTAGTDVCTVDVRVRAPDGIRVAASCVG